MFESQRMSIPLATQGANLIISSDQTCSQAKSSSQVQSPKENAFNKPSESQEVQSSYLVREKVTIQALVSHLKKPEPSQPESFLPNIKPLKPPGFSLQPKAPRKQEKMSSKGAIQRSLMNKYNHEYMAKKQNSAPAYEHIFQQIQVRQLVGTNEDGWQKPLTKLGEDPIKGTLSIKQPQGKGSSFQSLMSPTFHSQLQKFVQESNSLKSPPLLNLEELLTPSRVQKPIRHHIGISTAASVKLSHNRNISYRFNSLLSKQTTLDTQPLSQPLTSPKATDQEENPPKDNFFQDCDLQNEKALLENLPEIQQKPSMRNLDTLTFKKKPRRQKVNKILSTQDSQSYLQKIQNIEHPLWRHQSLLFCQSLKLEPVSTSNKAKSPTKKKEKKNLISHKNSMVVKKGERLDIFYTSIDPVTKRSHQGFSKRVHFNRKFERTQLPLLVMRYTGLLGRFDKEDLFSGTQVLNIRTHLSKFMASLHSQFQCVILIDIPTSKQKRSLVRKHLESVQYGMLWFYDAVYLSLDKNQASYDQIMLDFEVTSSRDHVFIMESVPLLDIDKDSKETQQMINQSICSEFDVTRILIPDLTFCCEQPGLDLLSISESLKSQFMPSSHTHDGLPYYSLSPTAILSALRFKAPLQPSPHQFQAIYSQSSEPQQRLDSYTYTKLTQQNMNIANYIAQYKQRYRERSSFQKSISVDTEEKQIIYLELLFLTVQSKKSPIERFGSVNSSNEDLGDIVREMTKKKYRQI